MKQFMKKKRLILKEGGKNKCHTVTNIESLNDDIMI